MLIGTFSPVRLPYRRSHRVGLRRWKMPIVFIGSVVLLSGCSVAKILPSIDGETEEPGEAEVRVTNPVSVQSLLRLEDDRFQNCKGCSDAQLEEIEHATEAVTQNYIALKRYEDTLVARKRRLIRSIPNEVIEDRHVLVKQLEEIDNALFNIKQSFKDYTKQLDEQIAVIKGIKSVNSKALLAQARAELERGNLTLADNYLEQIEQNPNETHELLALVAYERGKIAKQLSDFRNAFRHFEKAATLMPDNAAILNQASELALLKGKYQIALQWGADALEIFQKEKGEQSDEVAKLYGTLGLAYHETGDQDKAKALTLKALNYREVKYGSIDLEVATMRNQMGKILQSEGDYNAAKKEFELAMPIMVDMLGSNHPEVSGQQRRLGSIYSDLGNNAKAKKFLQIALDKQIKTLGKHHPKVALTNGDLGEVYQRLGKNKTAKKYFQQALISGIQTLGEDHPKVAVLRAKMLYAAASVKEKNTIVMLEKAITAEVDENGDKKSVYLERYSGDRDDESQEFSGDQKSKFARVDNRSVSKGNITTIGAKASSEIKKLEAELAILIKKYGEGSAKVASVQNKIGLLWHEAGSHKKALSYFEKALLSDLANFGEKSLKVASVRNSIGLVYRDLENYKKAEKQLSLALDIFTSSQMGDDSKVVMLRKNLGFIYQTMGSFEAARVQLEIALAREAMTRGVADPEVAILRNALGLVYRELGMHKNARKQLEKTLHTFIQHYGAGHKNVAILRNNIGLVYQDLKLYKESRVYLEQALVSDIQRYGKISLPVAKLQNNLGIVCQSDGDHKSAEGYFKQALLAFTRKHGAHHEAVRSVKNNLDALALKVEELEKSQRDKG